MLYFKSAFASISLSALREEQFQLGKINLWNKWSIFLNFIIDKKEKSKSNMK